MDINDVGSPGVGRMGEAFRGHDDEEGALATWERSRRADNNLGRIVQAELERSAVPTSQIIEVGAMSSVVGLVKAGAGVAFVPEYAIDFCRREGVHLISFTKVEQRSRVLSLLLRKNTRLSIAAASFVSLLKLRIQSKRKSGLKVLL